MRMELLAPAGNKLALHAAVQSGADAVYLGGPIFGARHSAENFTIDEMKRWVDYCHLYGVDVHVAVNTLIKERELSRLQYYVKELNNICVDALIVQDLGAAEVIKNTVPDMVLHGSTQMTVTSLEGVKYLENNGFSRVVLARELNEKEIEHICKGAKAEIEVFVHGAICMCYSGQCLMSSVLGGRSGNRGRCAQPCRLPYELTEKGETIEKGYALSPKDMALIDELDKLRKIGVSSLKIEGRLKRAEYVSAVVGIYRKYLDMGGKVSKSDMTELKDAFSRTGFTSGYFTGNLGKNMMSHDTSGNSSENKFTDEAKKRAAENANIRKIPVNIIASLKKDSPLEVTIYDNEGHYGYGIGEEIPQTAINKPLDEKLLASKLLKLGLTPFECDEYEVFCESGIIIPVKEINAVRRIAAENLINERQRREVGHITGYRIKTEVRKKPKNIILTAEVSNVEQLKCAVENGIEIIYAPKDIIKAADFPLKNVVTKAVEIFREEKIETDGVLVSSPAAAYKYKNKKLYGDFRLNIFNSQTADTFKDFEKITLSPELNLHEIKELCNNTNCDIEVIGYGRIPLMIMKNCPVKAMGKCQNGKNLYKLRDRKNEEFPLMCGDNCMMKLLNSKPVYMADKISDLVNLKINSIRLIFTVENFLQCDKIIKVYKNALENNIQGDELENNTFTRGHFYRGVL